MIPVVALPSVATATDTAQSLRDVLALVASHHASLVMTGLPVCVMADGRTRKALTARGFIVKPHSAVPSRCYVWPGEIAAPVHPQRVTRNILNPNGGEFLIEEDCPSYCDPGCESYHSM